MTIKKGAAKLIRRNKAIIITLTLILAANTCIAAESKDTSAEEKTFRQRVEEMIAKRDAEFALLSAKPTEEVQQNVLPSSQESSTKNIDVDNLISESQVYRSKLEAFANAPIEKPKSTKHNNPIPQPATVKSGAEEKTITKQYEADNNVTVEIKENSKLDILVDNTLNIDTQLFTYKRGETNKIYCAPGFITDIQLQPGEEISAAQVGDKTRWNVDIQFSPATGWHLYVKPIQLGVSTNMVITTDKHTYMIELVADPNYTPIVSWFYPGEARAALKEDQVMTVDNVDQLNFDYVVSKDKKYAWTPKFVFDDGFKTYINIPAGALDKYIPVIFMKLPSGNLILLDYTVSNENIVIDKVLKEIVMRVDNKVVNIKSKNIGGL